MSIKLFVILFISLFTILRCNEVHAQDVVVSGIGMKINTPRVPSLSIFQQDIPADTNNSTRFKTLPVSKVYRKSATIFASTVITLLKDSTYIAYFSGCLARGIMAGRYTYKGNTLILTGSEKVYRTLMKNEEVKALNYGVMEWGTLRYIQRKEGLVYPD